ncbi:MAG: hypothetical protein AB2695_21520, partial [Candidatus Thiodiazotropha endolucinida]
SYCVLYYCYTKMNHFHNCSTEYKDEKVQKLIHWLQTKSLSEESGKRPYVRTWLTFFLWAIPKGIG